MSQLVPTAPTIGVIARRLNVPQHRVEYVIRSRGIRPAARAGNARIFTEDDVGHIQSELARIESDRNSESTSRRHESEANG